MALVQDGRAPSIKNAIAMAAILCGSTSVALVFTAVAPVLPAIAKAFSTGGDGALFAQLMMTAPALGLMVGGPFTGWLVSRWGSGPVFQLCLALVVLSGTAGLWLSAPVLLLATRVVLGAVAMGAQVAATIMISERFEADARARLIGYRTAISAVGAIVFLLLGGLLGDRFGWRAPFGLFLLPLVLMGAALCIETAPPAAADASGARDSLSKLWTLWPLFASITVLAIPLNMPSVQIGFVLAADHVSSSTVQSAVIAMFSLTLFIASMAFGFVHMRLGADRLIKVAMVLLGAGFAVIGLVHHPVLTAAACAFAGFGAGLINPYFTVAIVERAPEALRGPALGLSGSTFFAGEFLIPLVTVPIRINYGPHAVFLAVGLCLLIVFTVGEAMKRARKARA